MRAYTIYKTFTGTEDELNKFMFDVQSKDKLLVISVHKCYQGTEYAEYELLLQKTIDTEPSVN